MTQDYIGRLMDKVNTGKSVKVDYTKYQCKVITNPPKLGWHNKDVGFEPLVCVSLKENCKNIVALSKNEKYGFDEKFKRDILNGAYRELNCGGFISKGQDIETCADYRCNQTTAMINGIRDADYMSNLDNYYDEQVAYKILKEIDCCAKFIINNAPAKYYNSLDLNDVDFNKAIFLIINGRKGLDQEARTKLNEKMSTFTKTVIDDCEDYIRMSNKLNDMVKKCVDAFKDRCK